MRILDVEIGSFRKLLSVRIGLAENTTLFVGANNSGKTSAMLALRLFLGRSARQRFTVNDFTLAHWAKLNDFGRRLERKEAPPSLEDWAAVVPTLDVWLHVENQELHYVSNIIPTLDWSGGVLGVRLRLEPKDVEALHREYVQARLQVAATLKGASPNYGEGREALRLWPEDMVAFLASRLSGHFVVRGYSLDPAALQEPKDGQARMQQLPADAEPVDGNPLAGIIRVDEIWAQRGFGHEGDTAEGNARIDLQKLSQQLSAYYANHLDPSKNPGPEDLAALHSIADAERAFDRKLETSFGDALSEMSDLGYPGLTDPKVTIATRIRPMDGLDHPSAVQYEVESKAANSLGERALRLPEGYNGLGYQNLISITFRLMSFRDDWMRTGKAERQVSPDRVIEPLHLVLIEEPEAHLHAQVQQVFIRKAYRILRKHKDLGEDDSLRTQVVVSTHSSHVAHEVKFANLRYFRRLPAGMGGSVPTSAVVNLSGVFGDGDETSKFVTRYLRTQHSDLFFADAAILVEGAAERMLVPLFFSRKELAFLSQRYISLLEIGGSHAHRLRNLIECLGLTTLVITDLDAANRDGRRAEVPQRGKDQVTSNPTLKQWLPRCDEVDLLLDAKTSTKVDERNDLFAVRVAYQLPVSVDTKLGRQETLPYTFEDALVLENRKVFSSSTCTGAIGKFRDAIVQSHDAQEMTNAIAEVRKACVKAEFAVSLIYSAEFEALELPAYIRDGLEWLECKLGKTREVCAEKSAVARSQ